MDKKVGKLIIISGPSGGGKNTILSGDKKNNIPGVFDRLPNLRFVPSNTTRSRRDEEIEGVDYNFWKTEDFLEHAKNNGFFEYVEYGGNYYGASRKDIEMPLGEGLDVLIVMTTDGLKRMLEADFVECPRPEIISIFIAPPDIETLRHRLERRSDVSHNLEKRLKAAEIEIQEGKELYDYMVLNEDGGIEKAISEVVDIISNRL